MRALIGMGLMTGVALLSAGAAGQSADQPPPEHVAEAEDAPPPAAPIEPSEESLEPAPPPSHEPPPAYAPPAYAPQPPPGYDSAYREPAAAHSSDYLPDGPYAPQIRPEAFGPDGLHRFERVGKPLTIAGLSCLGAGALVVGIKLAENGGDITDALLSDLNAGGILTASGLVLSIVGGSLWGVGVSKRDDYEKEKQPSAMPEVAVGPGSLSLSWQL